MPAAVSCALEGPDKGQPIATWEKAGVARVGGREFPASERGRQGFLLMPAGRFGPAFIATENFYVLKAYNESDLYALFIGHLADRMRGGKPFAGTWGEVDKLNRLAVRQMQERLEKRGVDVGGADGLVGFRTRVAVGVWQADNGLSPTCYPDSRLVGKVR
ncbi:MAG: lytic murein transglycosylase [Hyphomicrobiales bacterium]